MNAIRIRSQNADEKAVVVKSTIDETFKLASRFDESIQFLRDDLVVIKNRSDKRFKIHISVIRSQDGGVVVNSTRRQTHVLSDDVCSGLQFVFEPGEVLQIRSVNAQTPVSTRQ